MALLKEASRMYSRYGRQVSVPRSLDATVYPPRYRPILSLATSAPRSSKAMIEAVEISGYLLCLVDLICVDEIALVGQPALPTAFLVLERNRHARLSGGWTHARRSCCYRQPGIRSVCVAAIEGGWSRLRQERGWPQGRTVLFASAPNLASTLSGPESSVTSTYPECF